MRSWGFRQSEVGVARVSRKIILVVCPEMFLWIDALKVLFDTFIADLSSARNIVVDHLFLVLQMQYGNGILYSWGQSPIEFAKE